MPGITTIIRATPPVLPANYCLTTLQQLANDFFNGAVWEFRSDIGNSFYNFGDDVPAPENRIYPWLRTVGGYADDWYVFVAGAWLTLYKGMPAQVGAGFLQAYTGTEDSLLTVDGGENAPVGLFTGPFWEVDHAFDGSVPVGPGVLPSGASIALGDTGGTDQTTITGTNLPSHFHEVSLTEDSGVPSTPALGGFGVGVGATGSSADDLQWRASTTSIKVGYTRPNTSSSVQPTPFTNMQPYVAAYWVKRTARKYRRVDP